MANDWDVNDYRMAHETVDHWNLRKKFMVTHKDKFPEDKLVCLAQVFSNVEFMGCRYPRETMELVAELSRGVVEDYRNSRQSKLKRTFVAASDAAGAKVKGTKRPRESNRAIRGGVPNYSAVPEDLISVKVVQNDDSPSSVTYGPIILDTVNKRNKLSLEASSSSAVYSKTSCGNVNSPYAGVKTYIVDKSSGKSKGLKDVSDFVILRDNRQNESHLGLLLRSSSASGFSTETKILGQNGDVKCDVYINGKLFASAAGSTKKLAKEEAARSAIDKLQKSCYTILVKSAFIADCEIEKSQFEKSQPSQDPSSQHHLLHEDNIGNKLLRLMGWAGGGLGANQQGIKEPVSVQEHVRRTGLGISSSESRPCPEFKMKAWKILKEFAEKTSGGCNKDLVFSSDFSREERAEIHHLAHKLNLKSRSYKKQDRQLVVSHKYNMNDIVAELRGCGGSNDKYELIPPPACLSVVQID